MSKQFIASISPETIDAGTIPFDLYASEDDHELILFCKAGRKITADHKNLLKKSRRPLFIRASDKELYIDYSSSKLEKIITNPKIRNEDKANILHQVGRRCAKKIFEDPMNSEIPEECSTVVNHYVDLVLNSSEATSCLFELSAMDTYTYSHSVNVSTFNLLIGEKLFSRDRDKMLEIGIAGILHDIGKTRVDQDALFKKGPLTDSEFDNIKEHTVLGEEMVTAHGFCESIRKSVRNHHEYWGGSGYPDAIGKDDIHLFARITAVSDVYDAITSERVYKKPKPHFEALKDMSKEKGHFDPEIFNLLLDVVLRNDVLIHGFKKKYISSEGVTADELPRISMTDKKIF